MTTWPFRLLLALGVFTATVLPAAPPPSSFTMEQVKSYAFPEGLTGAATGSRIAWTFNESGKRNVWVAEGPEFSARRLTSHLVDDGQEITSLQVSADGRYVVYVRGGGRVAFLKDKQIRVAPIDGSAESKPLLSPRGDNGELEWSPDGSRLAFVSSRGDHAFVGVYTDEATPVVWLAPSTSRDGSPRWSPDGKRIAFVRRPGTGGAPEPLLERRHVAWAIWTADAGGGAGRERWRAPTTLRGSLPTTHGGTNLHWAAGGRIVFLSYNDGWPHLYSIAETGGETLLLTPGRYMAEHVRLSPDRRFAVFSGNTGEDADDIDRRHVVSVPVDHAEPRVLTRAPALGWTPVVTGDGRHIAFLGATPQRPPLPMVVATEGGAARTLADDRVPADFPGAQLVTPRRIVYAAPDGVEVHAQLFERPGGAAKKPAIVYVHGGPPQQMLLGWHYSGYYSNAYALNQYLAGRGFVVLSVNFRLGIGYGYEFHHPAGAGLRGAAEYQDVKAAAEWLRTQPQVDPARIGIHGGSYGGYLTALALARDSNLFAAGVDIHGVHDWPERLLRGLFSDARFENAPDAELAKHTAWRSSPVSSIATWRSPVLVIHADDDRNVRFNQSVDLVRRLSEAGVPYEELVIPDDTHHFTRHANQLRVNLAAAEFLERKLRPANVRSLLSVKER